MKKAQPEWEKKFDEMWFSPQSTIMNWEGLFKKQSFIEKLFGLGEWRNTIGQLLKKAVGEMIKDFIRTLLASQRQEMVLRLEKMKKQTSLRGTAFSETHYNQALTDAQKEIGGE